MAYERLDFENLKTVLTAEHLNHMQDGIMREPTIFTGYWPDGGGDYAYQCNKTYEQCKAEYDNDVHSAFIVSDLDFGAAYRVAVTSFFYQEDEGPAALYYTALNPHATYQAVNLSYHSDGTIAASNPGGE